MAITLTHIPAIMRANSWYNGAQLMDRWFAGAAAVAPAYAPPDTTTIRMDAWVLTFPLARDVYTAMSKEAIWASDRARIPVANVLRRAGRLGAPRGAFGNLALPAPQLHADHVNHRVVEQSMLFPDFNDLYAALGNFEFCVAIAGESEGLKSGETQVTVREVGVYVRDSYDFNGTQSLGYWSETSNRLSRFPIGGGGYVSNESFRNWRATNHRGGDFMVFSDVKRTVLASPSVFTVR